MFVALFVYLGFFSYFFLLFICGVTSIVQDTKRRKRTWETEIHKIQTNERVQADYDHSKKREGKATVLHLNIKNYCTEI